MFASEQADGFLELSDVEIHWDVNDLFWPERKALYRALVGHAAHRSDWELARRVLSQARESVQDVTGWDHWDRESGVAGGVKDGPIFYPWLKLAGVDQSLKNSCRVSFEVLKDAPPPLKIMVYHKKRQGSQHLFETNLSSRPLMRGEVVAVAVSLPPDVRLSDISVRVMSSLEWVSTPLRVDGFPDGRVPLGN